MKYPIQIFLLLALFCSNLAAQEFKTKVSINVPALQTADPKTFETLKAQVEEFYNNTSFTGKQYEDFEKIEFNLTIFIKQENSATSFSGDFLFQSLRPVFASDYKSQVINYIDKGFTFSYTELQPIRNNDNSFSDILSTLLTFYAYAILGYDYDTFSPFGGENYFQIAKNILDNVPESIKNADEQWSPTGPNISRYFLINDILNPKARDVRQSMYEYHRQGLDIMHDDPEKGIVVILNSLTNLEQVNNVFPNSQIIRMFTDAKKDEVVEVMKAGATGQKNRTYKIMSKLDPFRADQYQILNK